MNPEDLPQSRSEALELGIKLYFTGKPCKRGHLSPKAALKAECLECKRIGREKWAKDNADRLNYLKRQWDARNYEQELARKLKYANALPTEVKAYKKKLWKTRNPSDAAAEWAWRRARKRQATPAWANKKAIRKVYKDARQTSQETCIPHHVDHIIPLNGIDVCGLHVENNLQILPAEANIAKGRAFS